MLDRLLYLATPDRNRISGEGCYTMKINVPDQSALNRFLDDLLPFGNYRVNLSIGKIK